MKKNDYTYQTKLKKGDVAIVIGGKEKGKKGKILYINLKKGFVILEGVKHRKKFMRPSQESPKGSIIQIESPIHISNVMYYDDKKKTGARLGFEISGESKYRVVKEKLQKTRKID